ncbi:autophagy-related protein ATG18 [Acrasis kona]|uniref:Autophagy-related protein ATG18 n=1 Tax=Acrasis kona TaxID=1008807 RepID=A0AAW2Z883_9EUKA
MSCIHLNRIQPPPNSAEDLQFLGFNQDFSCVAAGVINGFRIFNCDPYKETFKREFSGSIGIVEMLFRCNILAIVGGGKDPAYSNQKVILWDDNQSTPIGELTFKTEVKAVKLRRDKIVVVLEKFVYVYNFDKLERLRKFETIPNHKGLVALSPIDDCVLAFPHTQKGVVRVELFESEKHNLINAHDSNINCISLNMEGTKLATASEKGTLIRIFDTITGQRLQEVRRGTDRADIYSIAFSPDSNFFCTSSDKGTIHIFALQNGNDQTQGSPKDINGSSMQSSTTSMTGGEIVNRKSKLSLFGGYFSSEWSFSWYKGPECPSVCCFGQDSKSVVVFTAEGSCIKLSFDTKKGGECIRKSFARFLKKK